MGNAAKAAPRGHGEHPTLRPRGARSPGVTSLPPQGPGKEEQETPRREGGGRREGEGVEGRQAPAEALLGWKTVRRQVSARSDTGSWSWEVTAGKRRARCPGLPVWL